MPKRLVDGDAIAKSKKLKEVPEWMRAEYALFLTLALGNGSFECDAETIWTDLYAFNRPSITSDKVREMFSEFERAKMLFRWESHRMATSGGIVFVTRQNRGAIK